MDKNDNTTQSFSMQDAMKLAQSDAGKQLYSLLQQTNAQQLQSAMDQAAAGDYEQVKNTMSAMLSSPEVRALLHKMGGQDHG